MHIKAVLNPRLSYSELPLKTYHRYALAPAQFGADKYVLSHFHTLGWCSPNSNTFWFRFFSLSKEVDSLFCSGVEGVVFTSLPSQRLLTLAVDVLESWLVRAKVAHYDMDNIRLSDVSDRVVHAQFELHNILLQGQCHDERGAHGPRGLELSLGTRDKPHLEDTLVMTNLGYFQLKANPTVRLPIAFTLSPVLTCLLIRDTR